MSGHHPFRELTQAFSPARQARIADTVQRLKDAQAQADPQQACLQAQAALATRLHVPPPAITQLECRTNLDQRGPLNRQ